MKRELTIDEREEWKVFFLKEKEKILNIICGYNSLSNEDKQNMAKKLNLSIDKLNYSMKVAEDKANEIDIKSEFDLDRLLKVVSENIKLLEFNGTKQ